MSMHTAIPRRRTSILLGVLVALLGLVLGCGTSGGPGPSSTTGGGGGPAASPTSDTLVIKNFAYEPASLTVAPGATVTVRNEDSAPHTVTADKSFDTGTITGGRRGQFTAPAKPGSYWYICTIHQYMTGTLIVK